MGHRPGSRVAHERGALAVRRGREQHLVVRGAERRGADQPDARADFVNYNFAEGWYATTSPNITANWKAANNNRWTVPLGGGFGKIFKIEARR